MTGAVPPPSQARVARALTHALTHHRLPHGLLFLGAPGAGREQTARALAAALLCSVGGTPWGCGACSGCTRALKATHPDLHQLMTQAEAVRRGLAEPDGKKKPSEQILVEDVRALAGALRMTAYDGGARAAIVIDAHRMNPNAQNALLKTLEEPGARTLIVLTAPDEQALLPTIVSRCLRLRFAPPPIADAAPGDERLLAALVGGTTLERLDAAEAIGRDRAGTEATLEHTARGLMEMARRAAAGGVEPLGWPAATALVDAIAAQRRAFLQNANAQLALEELVLTAPPPGPQAGSRR